MPGHPTDDVVQKASEPFAGLSSLQYTVLYLALTAVFLPLYTVYRLQYTFDSLIRRSECR